MLTKNTNHNQSLSRPLTLSLFSGVGGLDLGFSAVGFEIALAIEKDPTTARQYQQNFPHTPVICADIRHINPAQIKKTSGGRSFFGTRGTRRHWERSISPL